MTAAFVTTRRAGHGGARVSRGTVFDSAGVLLGRVQVHSRDAAGTYGPGGPRKARFWTAELYATDGSHIAYLGTRHPNRAHAMRALRLFADAHPACRAPLWGFDTWHADARQARREAVARFKRDNREVCALDASPMVRVYDPDA